MAFGRGAPAPEPASIGSQRKGDTAMAFDHLLLARVTLATIGWAALTVVADFNRTHATNPKWTPHARFHVVWQISSYVGFGLLALALIWWPGPLAIERLYLVAVMSAIVYVAFFAALAAMPAAPPTTTMAISRSRHRIAVASNCRRARHRPLPVSKSAKSRAKRASE
jgi:hypothetical protein